MSSSKSSTPSPSDLPVTHANIYTTLKAPVLPLAVVNGVIFATDIVTIDSLSIRTRPTITAAKVPPSSSQICNKPLLCVTSTSQPVRPPITKTKRPLLVQV